MKKYILAAALVLAATNASAIADRTVVLGSGDSGVCFAEKTARRNAEAEAYNNARTECQNINGRFGSKIDNGNEYVTACSGFEAGNYRVKVSGAQFYCNSR